MPKAACSEPMERYFKSLENGAEKAYRVAERARAKGFDPSTQVEVPRADDLASRVEKLLRIDGLAPRIRELSETNDRENVSILVAKETAANVLERGGDKEKALDSAVRVGLAVLTEGILVAPLDGIVAIRIIGEDDSSYASVSYSSPIASAGGTALALSVLIADLVRRDLGIGAFHPTDAEVERWKEEVPLYRQVVALQYLPTGPEIEAAVRGCPVCIDGEGTERSEVSGHRDLPRIGTNRLRGGACLVVANGLCHKSAKLKKHVENLRIDGWDFLTDILRLQTSSAEEDRTKPNEKYLKDQLAGRPVLSEASRPGGFRLRYGRSRSTGIAALGVHPATMALLGFVAVGTQLKIERPGKACAATPCDSIDGPWVLLEDGELLQLVSAAHAEALSSQVHEIVDLGDILVPFGEFAENNHPLMPAAWVEEWWSLELEKRRMPEAGDAGQESLVARSARDSRAAVELARLGTPLHPKFTYVWHDLDAKRIIALRDRILSNARIDGGNLILEDGDGAKRALVDLCVAHRGNQTLRIAEPWALLAQLGLESRDRRISETRRAPPASLSSGPMDLVRALSLLDIRERAPTRIGTRMGRPEKAKERRMKPPVNLLFPLREGAVRQRGLEEVMDQASILVEVQPRRCVEHGHVTYVSKCACGSWSEPSGPPGPVEVDIATMLKQARERLGSAAVDSAAEKVKGVLALISRDKTPECLEKGLLRAARDIYVFKDGTVRFDATDVPLTHFTPREAGITVEKARELGYSADLEGRTLERDDQLLELRVQDLLMPKSGLDHLFKVSKFVDDLLMKLYGLDAFYDAKSPEDLIGALVVGLAPHTSGGVLARVVGSLDAKVCY
ncbi:MAG TPA: DNA polymerase II large subunit, partial [Thermoplasmata archaeon]|nr:DNA polymerase II large subunit [Thermoplasmata archaeon]